MTRSPTLAALTRRRFATPRSAALVIVALVAFAAFVIAAAPRALVGVVRAEVAYQVSDMPAISRDLSASLIGAPAPGVADDPALTADWDEGAAEVFGAVAQLLADNRGSLDPELESLVGEARFAVYSQPIAFDPEDLDPQAPISIVQLFAEPAMASDVSLVEGEWPRRWTEEGPVEIVLSASAAETMMWPIGEVRSTSSAGESRTLADWEDGAASVVLVGTVEAVDAEDDRWTHLPTALTATVFDDGDSRPTATSVAWIHPGTWAQLGPSVRAEAQFWYPVDGRAAVGEEPTALLSALRSATSSSVAVDETGQLRVRFESEIVGVLSTALSRANSASAILAVAAVGPLAVSVALVVLASALMIRRRRADLSLLSARGAPLWRLRRLLLGEGLILGMPIAVVAAVAAVAVTPDDAGPAPTIIAIAVGTVPGIALALTLRPSLLERGRADLDAPVRSRAARIVEAVVLVLAAAAVVQLVLRGIGSATDGIDPIVVAAPFLATVAVAIMVVRLHPLPLAAALRISRRGRGVVALVGSARNLRDSAAGTTAVLAMLVAVAIAVFSSLILATVDRGAVTAAQRDVGADIRIAGPYVDDATIDAMREVDGVEEVAGVLRGDYLPVAGPEGRESVQVMVADLERLAVVQHGMEGGVPEDAIRPDASPLRIIASTALVDELGGMPESVADTPVEVAATLDRVLGVTGAESVVLMDRADYTNLTGSGFFPRTVMVDVSPAADAEAIADELGDIVGSSHTVRILERSTAEIQASPAVSALRFVLFAALGVAVALSVIALLLVAGVSRDARSRVIALLRSMGLDRGRSRGIVAWEFVPLGATSLVGGVVLGALLPLLVVSSIDLRPFTGGGGQPSISLDPVLSGALIAVVVTALAVAVFGGVLTARTTSLATVLRTEED